MYHASYKNECQTRIIQVNIYSFYHISIPSYVNYRSPVVNASTARQNRNVIASSLGFVSHGGFTRARGYILERIPPSSTRIASIDRVGNDRNGVAKAHARAHTRTMRLRRSFFTDAGVYRIRPS